jgi:hypothetical protein
LDAPGDRVADFVAACGFQCGGDGRDLLGIMSLVDRSVANAADDETMHILRLDHGDTQSDSGTEREADEINAVEAKTVEERYDVCRERGRRATFGFMDRVAPAVARKVQPDNATPARGQQIDPAGALPGAGEGRGKAMQEQDGLALAEIFVVQF